MTNAADVEQWHRDVSRAMGRLAGALARRRRPPELLSEVAEVLETTARDIRAKEENHEPVLIQPDPKATRPRGRGTKAQKVPEPGDVI